MNNIYWIYTEYIMNINKIREYFISRNNKYARTMIIHRDRNDHISYIVNN